MKRIVTALSLALVICALCVPLRAQGTAQINGTVRDQSGAVLPGVEITATQTQTGIARSTISNETGSYVLPTLPIGTYKIEAALPGFRTFVQTGIELQVNSNPVINPVLEVGQVSEQVEVQANAALVETRNQGVGQVIENSRILELPLNGRSVQDLISLSAATVPVPTGSGTLNSVGLTPVFNRDGAVSLAGGLMFGVSYTLDGATHNNPTSGANLSVPFPDALQEFKVETSGLSAQNGMHSSGAVTLVTKSGSNAFHGDLFEFVRNGKFNARNTFALTRDTLKRNQFGGTLGGPIVQNKLFFFGGYQGTITRSDPSDTITFVPTAAMLAGDFTAVTTPACNAGRAIALRAPFVNNRIDPSQFSKVGLAAAKLLPTSTDPCGRLVYGVPAPENYNMAVGKVDYQLTAKHSTFARYLFDRGALNQPNRYDTDKSNILFANLLKQTAKEQAITLGDTYLLTSNTVNAFRVSYNRGFSFRSQFPDLPSWPKLGSKMYGYPDPSFVGLAVTGGVTLQTGAGGGGGNFKQVVNTYGFNDDVSWVHGTHQVAFGGSALRMNEVNFVQSIPQGGASFNGSVTGLGYADLLTGTAATFLQNNPTTHNNSQWFFGTYLADTWKATRKLTASYGVRWEPLFPVEFTDGTTYLVDLAKLRQGIKTKQYTNAPPGVFYIGDPGVGKHSVQNTQWGSISPRLGLAWDVSGDGRTSVRAAYGLFYDFIPLIAQFGTNNIPPFSPRITLQNVKIDDPWANYLGGNPYPLSTSVDAPFPPASPFRVIRPDLKPPQVSQWNLSIQRQIGTDWLVSGSYVGSNTVHLWAVNSVNQAVFLGLGPCTLAGVAYPSCSTQANTQQRRILSLENPAIGQFFGAVDTFDDGPTASYHGLLLNVQRRAARGITLNGNYTWSHCISDPWSSGVGGGGSYTDPSNRRFDRGNCASSAIDRRHLFNFSAVATTPSFSNSTLRMIASDWRFSPILRLRSGTFMTITTTTDVALTGISNQRVSQLMANVYGNKTPSNYLNSQAFALPATGTLGNVGASTVQGPGYWTLDIALARTVKVRENQRVEFRAEAFNLTNSVRYNNPTSNLSTNTFGQITSALDPRIMQFALKYVF
jgi:carboxypeptidase family protein